MLQIKTKHGITAEVKVKAVCKICVMLLLSSYFRTIVFDRVGAKEGEEAEDVVRRRETKGLLNPA